MKSRQLPDHCTPGYTLRKIGGIVIHYFSAKNVDVDRKYEMSACWDLFVDLNLPKEERYRYLREDKWPNDRMYASAHILISRDGEVWKLVDFDKRAYHAGRSMLNGKKNCNRWTLGIELLGDANSGFTDEQYEALAKIVDEKMLEHDFEALCVAGHDTVRWNAIEAGDATSKKYDPSGAPDGNGDNFDWNDLWHRVGVLREGVPA